MTKKNAIKILLDQKMKLDTIQLEDERSWVAQTTEYIRIFIGENSDQFKLILNHEISQGRQFSDVLTKEMLATYRKSSIKELKMVLDTSIEVIRIKGIPFEPKQNLLQRLDNSTLLTFSPIVIGIIFTCGMWTERLTTKDSKALEDVVKYKDSLSYLRILNSKIEQNGTRIISDTSKYTNKK